MYVVAATRWASTGASNAGPPPEAVAAVAPLIGVTPYDARLRLAGPLPVVVGRTAEVDVARRLVATLRDQGQGAVAFDDARVASSTAAPPPRSFELEADSFVAVWRGAGRQELRYGQVFALVRAACDRIEQSLTTKTARHLSVSRAVLSGGLAFTKETTEEERHVSKEREQLLYVFRRSGEGTLVLQCGALRYSGLRDRVAPTTPENFDRLVAALRERATGAWYDERLVAQHRAVTIADISSLMTAATVSMSSAAAVDLAAHTLAVAHLQNQL